MRIHNHIYLLLALAAFASCGSNEVIEKVEEITKDGTDPMRFGKISEIASSTRASSDLTSDFLVSTYKAFGAANQHVVMDKYIVKYSVDAWNNTSKWDYSVVEGQYLRYWDYSSFPYRFNAIAPCPPSCTLTDKALSIIADYKYQHCANGTVTPSDSEAEPYMVAQVERKTNGEDFDIYASAQIGDENSNKTLNRFVALPFHHLNSKIRFAVYTKNLWATDNKLYIKDLKINVASNNFVTGANKYDATGTDSWKIETGNAGFSGCTKATDKPTLLSFSGYDVTNLLLEDNDLRKHQGKTSAYFLQCPTGMMQIPQEGVKMNVSLKLMNEDNYVFRTFENIPIVLQLEDDTTQTTFNWKSGYIYTYYLILEFDEETLEIEFTATLAPWEDISGSLSTDLEQ